MGEMITAEMNLAMCVLKSAEILWGAGQYRDSITRSYHAI